MISPWFPMEPLSPKRHAHSGGAIHYGSRKSEARSGLPEWAAAAAIAATAVAAAITVITVIAVITARVVVVMSTMVAKVAMVLVEPFFVAMAAALGHISGKLCRVMQRV